MMSNEILIIENYWNCLKWPKELKEKKLLEKVGWVEK